MRIRFYIGFWCLMMCSVLLCYIQYYNKWKYIWEQCPQLPIYTINQQDDDTLRVGMIGDSWAYLHNVTQMDTFLISHTAERLGRPVKVVTKGKNGDITREIYKNMFSCGIDGTKSIIYNGLNYCIISAGINDACRNLGVEQYLYHYRKIIDFLLSNSICPIIIEIPNANVRDPQLNKPVKEIIIDYVRSFMTGSPMYHCARYRDGLKKYLIDEGLMKDIIYLALSEWNGTELNIKEELSLSDQIHLNLNGYEKLDSAIIQAIIKTQTIYK